MKFNFYNDMLRAAEGASGAGDGGDGKNDKGAGSPDNKGAGSDGKDAGAGEGGAPKAWQDDPRYDHVRQHPIWDSYSKQYTSEASFIQAALSTKQMVGMDKIGIPKGDADWENVYNALGRPQDAAGYDIKPPEAGSLPEGLEYNKDLENEFRSAAHKAGLNNKQAAELQKFWMGFAANMHTNGQKAYATERATAENELKRDLGNAYDGHVAAAKAALSEYADPKFLEFLETSGFGNHPEIVRIFGKIGRETLGEEKLKGVSKGEPGMSPAELDAQISEHRNKYSVALYDKLHPDHQVATDKLTALMKLKFPEKAAA